MSRSYRFECYDSEDRTSVNLEFTTDAETWSGFDGPMCKFMDFLRGCGYVFEINAEIGVMDEDGFSSAQH